MNAFMKPKCFIVNRKAQEVLTIILHTPQMTQAMNLLETMPKFFFYLVVTNLFQAWPLYFLSMFCIWEGL